jgi:hypothetical protein
MIMWPQVGYYHRQKSNTCTETLEEADRHDQSNAGKNCIIASLDELSKGSRPAGTDITGAGHPPRRWEIYLIQKVSRLEL